MTTGRFFLWLSLTVFLGGLFPGISFATTAQEIENLIRDEKASLDKLKRRIKKREKEISKMGKKESKFLKTLGALDNKKKIRERELQIYRWNIEINRKQKDKIFEKIKITEKQLDLQKKVLGHRLRTLYKEGRMFPVKILFSSENFNDLLQKARYMEDMMDHDSRIFLNYNKFWNDLKREEKKLAEAKEQLVLFEKAALEKKKQIVKERRKKEVFLNKIKSKKIYVIQARKELLKASSNLNDLIGRLEEKMHLGEGLKLVDKKGHLSFPVEGKIISRFGRIRDKHFGTKIINNGLDLKVRKGSEVRAIFHGKVLFADSLEGYGNLLILGHGDNYHSLYGHLDQFKVEKGARVMEGQIIGLSGDSGSLRGETLYLEIRHNGKPINPIEWLQTAKRKLN